MELMDKTLYTAIYNYQIKNWNERIQYCIEIAEGLDYLHSNDIIHRDLKSLNILISFDNLCKISDLGCATTVEDEKKIKVAENGFVYRAKQFGCKKKKKVLILFLIFLNFFFFFYFY